MAELLSQAWDGYKLIFDEWSDPRTKEWFLVAKPYEPIAMVALYLMFVFKWGPDHMKNRQPYKLKYILIAYNTFQVAACSYIFVKAIFLAWGWHYKWFCEPVDFSTTPRALEIARFVYYYYMLKVIDLLDTVFFVLRKKNNQVTFLHIYHHTGMVFLIWGAITYMPGGHGTLVGVINSFVHVVMYSYYLLTVAKPSIKNAIWIKKFVTQLQILQFFWCVVHMTVIVFKTDCEFPRWTSAFFLPQNLFMLVLFINFYIKTYINEPKEQLETQANATKANNQNNSIKNNDIQKNGNRKTKCANKLNKDMEIIDARMYLKNDLSKLVNGNDVSYTNNSNEFSENVNIFENGKEKSSTCATGKCKINCHKHFKNE